MYLISAFDILGFRLIMSMPVNGLDIPPNDMWANYCYSKWYDALPASIRYPICSAN